MTAGLLTVNGRWHPGTWGRRHLAGYAAPPRRTGGCAQRPFGTEHIHGVEAIKAFFVKIGETLIITHEILEFWTAGDGVRLLRGEATMAKKTEPDRVVRAPFIGELAEGRRGVPLISCGVEELVEGSD
ncbi:hypothetical protein ACWKT5_25085 [Streptomyces avermitilis]